VARESFSNTETVELLSLLDEAARRSAVSRGQAFEDFLQMTICTLSGGQMESAYLETVEKHSRGAKGKRGCDSLAELFGAIVRHSEETREDIKDLLGDLFQGAITYGEAGQFLTPMPVCRAMARMTTADISDEDAQEKKRVLDPCSGSGRMLLAVAELHRHWEFVGQDVDLRKL
jgi:type I restriction-modification system DNA methylase subunit